MGLTYNGRGFPGVLLARLYKNAYVKIIIYVTSEFIFSLYYEYIMVKLVDKTALVLQIIGLLERKSENFVKAAKTAHADATGEESKAENKYDTRGLEASYLAGAQAAMAAESAKDLACYKTIRLKEFTHDSKIDLTAFIELESEEGVQSFYFMGPKSGGLGVEYEGNRVLLITPSAPLGRELMGREVGDFIEINASNSKKGYEIVGVS